jgi:hypothetical protein
MRIKHFLFILLLSLSLPGMAQGDLLMQGRLWTMVEVYCQPQGNVYTSHYLEIGQDTTIDNITYKNLRYSADEGQQEWYDYGGYIRETPEGKIYYRRTGTPEGLIYDFSAKPGDTVTVINYDLIAEVLNLVVLTEDSVLLEDGWHRMLSLQDDAYPGIEVWIEGVGSMSGLAKSGLNSFGASCGDYDLLCTSDNGNDVYVNPQYPSCWYVYTKITDLALGEQVLLYPNPVQGILHIEGEFIQPGETYTLQLSDFTGRLLINETRSGSEIDLSSLSSGIYIINIQSEAGRYSGKVMKQ